MGKKEEQPPSLFDNLDMFAAKPVEEKGEAAKSGEAVSRPLQKKGKTSSERSGQETASPLAKPFAEASKKGLTGTGPMQELYDFNFRQYSAYVICDRAIPAVEDGLKPVQRRIMHSLWE